MEKGESNNTQLFHKRNLSNYLIHSLLRWITELPAEKEIYFLGSLSNASIHLKFSVKAILRKVFSVCISVTNCTAALLSKLLKCVTKVVLQQHSSPAVKAFWVLVMQTAVLVEINLTSSIFFNKIWQITFVSACFMAYKGSSASSIPASDQVLLNTDNKVSLSSTMDALLI